MSIENTYQAQQAFFVSGATLPYAYRRKQLKLLKKAVKRYERRIMAALHADLHKPPMEAFGSEVGLVYGEIKYCLHNLKRWMRPEPVSSPFMLYPSQSKIHRAPLGQTLIIGPWNYPFSLVITPLIGAIAGGNCAILKPSELAPHTAAVIANLVHETFAPAYVTVIDGEGSEVIPALMQHRFDHVFFTGSTNVGKKILEMAAPHLTPVTLELGGKSPCVVDDKVDIQVAAQRIIWGKYFNAGQTCIAPDYVLVHAKVKEALIAAMKKAITSYYGDNPAASKDYARIINKKRFDTLNSYLSKGTILHGGDTDAANLYIGPTLMENAAIDDEIFGPILPIMTYEHLGDAIQYIKQHPAPLSLYVFTKRSGTEKTLIEQLSFGGACVNNTLGHYTNVELPFGGVGYSGMGQYHGKYNFLTFTHAKAVMKTGTWLDVKLKYPPYRGLGLLKRFMK
ncbi:aldehyde dehydrogenase [Chitinophaga sancti]|uniref:aldehyde dehydrogenase n=1 Tax=Chitinophaga sancti TaxID=1004 RepID=UPI003F797571